MSKRTKKEEAMAAARSLGWRGKTYEKAARFGQAAERVAHPPKESKPGEGSHSSRKRS